LDMKTTAAAMTQEEARKLYALGNNSGHGYAPYTDVPMQPGDESIAAAIEAAQADGWEIEIERETSEDVAVLRNGDGEMMAIGGEADGSGAWAVIISDVDQEDPAVLANADRF
jgi:hypothetical protein